MPLTDLVRNLNDLNHRPAHWAQGIAQFISSDGRVFVRFANLFLESVFQPIVETATGKIHGHAASLQAYRASSWLPVDAETAFSLPGDDDEFVYLDRLVRTLHALNYLAGHLRGNLLLRVHPRHVAAVPSDHGLAFEEILRPYGLLPRQITLELDIDGIPDTDHLKQAVKNYRSRGYGIAVSRFGHSQINFNLIDALQPDLVKLDALLLASTRPLSRLIRRLHQTGARVAIEGADTPSLRKGTARLNVDLLQVHAPTRQRTFPVAKSLSTSALPADPTLYYPNAFHALNTAR